MKKNKKGFTLIELLVVIVLVLSLLGIAIVSFINVSKNKKKESWETVKIEIETAAEEYFTYNEYLFEGLANGSKATISVGKLVSEDYLNKVINPVTGKTVSSCMVVNVIKENGVFKVVTDETTEDVPDGDCDTSNIISISEPGAPSLSTQKKCGKEGNGDWCIKNDANKGVEISVTTSEDAISLEYEVAGEETGRKYLSGNFVDNNNTSSGGKTVCFLATGSNGAKSSSCIDYYIDMTPPIASATISSMNENYNSNFVKVDLSAQDNESGLATAKYDDSSNNLFTAKNSQINSKTTWNDTLYNRELFKSLSKNEKTAQGTITVEDVAGNETSNKTNNYSTYMLCSNKMLDSSSDEWSSCSEPCNGGTQKKITTNYYIDAITGDDCGSDSSENGSRSCNTQACATYQCPSISIKSGTVGNNGWYTSKVEFNITAKDNTTKWHWLTNIACDPSGDSSCKLINGKTYRDWGENTGSLTKDISSEGARSVIVGYYDSSNNFVSCDTKSVKVDKTPPTVKVNSVYTYTVDSNYSNAKDHDTITSNGIFKITDRPGYIQWDKTKTDVSFSDNLTDSSKLKTNSYSDYIYKTEDGNCCKKTTCTGYRNGKTKKEYAEKNNCCYDVYTAKGYCDSEVKICTTDEAGNVGCGSMSYKTKYK